MKMPCLLVLVACLFVLSPAVAQFRTAFGIGVGPQKTGLVGVYAEPSFKFRNFAVGLKGESMFLRGNYTDQLTNSLSVFGQYYFVPGPMHFFAGVGGGVYSPMSGTLLCDCTHETSKNLPGFFPRFGFEYRHLVVTADYNFIHRVREVSQSTIPNQPSEPHTSYYSINYFALKVGILLGGGK